jgi:hypothetical protein
MRRNRTEPDAKHGGTGLRREDSARDEREDVGDYSPKQQTRQDHSKQIDFISHAVSLPWSD